MMSFRFCTLLITLLLACHAYGRTYLVAIGMANYPGASHDLQACVRDARDVRDLYQQTDDCSTGLITNEKATVKGVFDMVRKVFANAGSDDQLVIYFSGHGVKGGFVLYDGLLTYENIQQIFSSYRCKRKVVIADACLSGRLRGKNRSREGRSSTDVMFFLSSRDNEPSRDSSGRNGLFTGHLLQGLRGAADADRNGKVSAHEIFTYVSGKVKNASRGKQHPVMWGNFPNDMTVIKYK